MTSSTVMTPTSLFSSSTTGIASRLYDATRRATSSWSVSVADAGQIRRHDPLERRRRRHEQQPAQRDDADEVAARVDDVEIEDHLDVARPLERGDRLARRHVLRKREDFRVHDAAGGLLVVLEQLADFVARAFFDQLEDGGRQRFRAGCR